MYIVPFVFIADDPYIMAEELRPSGPHSSESQKAFDVFRPPGYQKPVQSGDSHQHLLNDVHEGECDQNITQCGGPNSALDYLILCDPAPRIFKFSLSCKCNFSNFLLHSLQLKNYRNVI